MLKAKFDLGSGKIEGGALQGASYKAGVSVKCSEVTVSLGAVVEPAWPCSAGFGKMAYATVGAGRQADRRLRQQGRRRAGAASRAACS